MAGDDRSAGCPSGLRTPPEVHACWTWKEVCAPPALPSTDATAVQSRCASSAARACAQGHVAKTWKERWFVLPGHGPLLLWYDTGTAVLPRKAVQCVAVSDTVQAEAGNFGGSTAGWSFDVWAMTAEGTESLESSTGAKMNRFLRRMSTSAIDKEVGRTKYVLAAPSMKEAA